MSVRYESYHQHIKKYFQYLNSKGLSESYANGILKSLRVFFRIAGPVIELDGAIKALEVGIIDATKGMSISVDKNGNWG